QRVPQGWIERVRRNRHGDSRGDAATAASAGGRRRGGRDPRVGLTPCPPLHRCGEGERRATISSIFFSFGATRRCHPERARERARAKDLPVVASRLRRDRCHRAAREAGGVSTGRRGLLTMWGRCVLNRL